jgi:hypothetical protein
MEQPEIVFALAVEFYECFLQIRRETG